MNDKQIYDIIGIGIGPFNLGLAALAHGLPELKCLFIDSKEQFDWHPGMLIPGTRMQVPFYADLVTLVDPCSPFSYLNFLHAKERMLAFGVLENNYPLRSVYNEYCQWVAEQLPSLEFGMKCEVVHYLEERKCYQVVMRGQHGNSIIQYGRRLVIGVGTIPFVPVCTQDFHHPMVFHSSQYLFKKKNLLKKKKITIVGSGQSAAEIFRDLLNHINQLQSITWFTRSERLFPMDVSKFALEMASPEYMRHFYNFPLESKISVLQEQNNLYKGINNDLIADIYEQLSSLKYHGVFASINIVPHCALQTITTLGMDKLNLQVHHLGYNKTVSLETEAVLLATGYRYATPSFLTPIKEHIQWLNQNQYAVKLNYSIDQHNTLFVQNADHHTHGFNSADLSMGPHRNAIILNTILGVEHFKIEKDTTFQCFNPFSLKES